ncbi:DUOXA-like protein C06E1.3 [Aphelenchoides fujianensis]|nr:DUOXA-like protein C06E1.3 [Aphelenchoides fujianensis]
MWWFAASRTNGEPVYFGENRTPVVADLHVTGMTAAFIIPILAFLIILPGVRRHRFISAWSFLFSMVVGGTILVSICYPCWQQSEARVFAPYRTYSSQRMDAVLNVKIGLTSVNVTIQGHIVDGVLTVGTSKMNYNERFDFAPGALSDALVRGAPYPLLKTIEYLSVEDSGFLIGRQYRVAGYYTAVLLWFALACWCVQMLFLCFYPPNFPFMSTTVGIILLTANAVYFAYTPKELCIKFPDHFGEQSVLDFRMSHCFYVNMLSGILNVLFGSTVMFLQKRKSYVFETFLCPDFSSKRPSLLLDALPRHQPCLSSRSLFLFVIPDEGPALKQ